MESYRIALVLSTAEKIKNIDRTYMGMMFDRILVSFSVRVKGK